MNIGEWLKERTFCHDEFDEILCVSFLLGKGKFTLDSNVQEWTDFFEKDLEEYCENCPFVENCPCCAINE